jgi:hypothetical protein
MLKPFPSGLVRIGKLKDSHRAIIWTKGLQIFLQSVLETFEVSVTSGDYDIIIERALEGFRAFIYYLLKHFWYASLVDSNIRWIK